MASYQELLANFMQSAPQEVLALQGTDAFGDAFNKWAGDIMADLGVGSWEEIPVAELGNYEYVAPGSATTGPAEQQIFNQIAPGLVTQIQGDAARQEQVGQLTDQTNAAFGSLRDVLGQAQAVFDGAAYLRANPDVAAAYAQDGTGMSVDDYARRHYETFGRAEGRAPTFTSEVLRSQIGNVNATTGAISDAARTAAGERTAALGQMTTAQLGNLEQSLATQRAALEQEVASLQGNASAAAAARRTALEQQINELRAAQAPVAEARMRAAESEVTGINLALEGTRDQLAAEAAREGFVGPSSFTEGALARAAIDARQGAARSIGGARVANAEDDRAIGSFGANQRFSIADVLAGDTQRAGDYGASSGARLTAGGAEAGRGIRDQGAQGIYDIATTLSTQLRDASDQGARARAGYADQLFPNAVNSAQALTAIPGAQANALQGLIPLGTAGANNALQTLSWWSNPATAPSSTAVMTNPSTTGNNIANLGTGLLGSAFQIGAANNWWQKPAGVGAATTYDQFLKNNPTSSAATGPWG